MSNSTERSKDVVLFFGLTTGPTAIRRVVRGYRGLGLLQGEVHAFDFPTMMREVRRDRTGLRQLVDGRQVKTHSAGSLVVDSILESGAKPATLNLYNEVVATNEEELLEGGGDRFARHIERAITGILHHSSNTGNAIVAATTAWQSIRHGASNFEFVDEIGEYTAADPTEQLVLARLTECTRLTGREDEFPTFRRVRAFEGAHLLNAPGCHDNYLVDPRPTIAMAEGLPEAA